MILDKKQNSTNNMERQQGGTTFRLDSLRKVGKRHEENEYIEIGDVIVLGLLGENAVTTDMRLLVQEPFPAGTLIDIGFPRDDGSVVVFASNVMLDTGVHQIVIPVPADGVLNPDGTQYVGENGGIWAGSGGVEIAVLLKAGVMDGTGEVDFVNSHTYFVGKSTGGYIR